MTEKLSDERLAELLALQQKRIEGRGGVPEVRDLLKALDELAAFRAHEPERLGITEPKSAVSCRSGSHPMSGEARREAERRWPLWLPTGDYETDQENYNEQSAKWQNAESEEHQRAFVRGTQWQAARDAARIAELKAEVERLRDVLTGIKERDAEVGEDESWWIGGAWGEYGEAVVPLRILSYVIDGNLDEKVASIDPGFALTYAEQVARADAAEAKLARIRELLDTMQVGGQKFRALATKLRATLDGDDNADDS